MPLILTDTPRIPNEDMSALRKALARWDAIDEPTPVVLPIEPWWLREGLPGLIEEVRAAGRPVAVVLLHRYNGLDIKGAVASLLKFISAWWETCNAGAKLIASLAESGVSLPLRRWLRQWLELGSPAHDYRPVG